MQSLYLSSWTNKNHNVKKKTTATRSRTSYLCFRWPHYAPPHSYHSLNWLPLFLVHFDLGWKLCLLGCSPLSAANRVFHSKFSVSNPSYLSRTFPWMEVDSGNYDGWLWTARNWGQQSLYLMYQKCSATSVYCEKVLCTSKFQVRF